MICERCGVNQVSKVTTEIIDGEKVAIFLCERCLESSKNEEGAIPELNRPCPLCRRREGTVKLTQLQGDNRRVRFLCDECAKSLSLI